MNDSNGITLVKSSSSRGRYATMFIPLTLTVEDFQKDWQMHCGERCGRGVPSHPTREAWERRKLPSGMRDGVAAEN